MAVVELVQASFAVELITPEEISKLYQRDELRIMLKENGLSYHVSIQAICSNF